MAQMWQPQQGDLVQICQLLTQSQQPGKNQREIIKQLNQFGKDSNFNLYLMYIFAQGDQYPVEVRQVAGLLLKNNLKQQLTPSNESLWNHVKVSMLQVLTSHERVLRQTAGTIITTVVGESDLQSWPELVQALLQGLQGSDAQLLDGALDTLYKIAEDHPFQIEASTSQIPGHSALSPTSILVPPLLFLMQSQIEQAREQAVRILNMLARNMPPGIQDSLDTYVQGLFTLATDSSPNVRKEVISGLIQMLEIDPARLVTNLPQIIQYMLQSTEDGNDDVALESCEFWTAFCDAASQNPELDSSVLRPFLPQLIPLLLKNMVYDDYDEEVQEAQAAETSSQEDKDADIQPQHLRSALKQESERGPSHIDTEEDLDEEEEEEEFSRWNLRKCSARGLDTLSTLYGDDLLPYILPVVQQRLQDANWKARESAILALGAVSDGCHRGLMPHLKGLVAMLLPMLADAQPMVRIISCWAVARYCQWLLYGPWRQDPAHPPPDQAAGRNGSAAGRSPYDAQLFDTALQELLNRLLDHNKQVQTAACSGVAMVEDYVAEGRIGAILQPKLKVILQHFALALTKYGRRNMRVLYDAIITLANAVGNELSDQSLNSIVMKPILEKWDALQATDMDLPPLLECLAAVAPAIGKQMEMYAKPLFDKSIKIIILHMELQKTESPEYEADFVSCALDLISSLSQALGATIESLVGESPLVEIILQACQDEAPEVRQLGFALIGDLSRACIGRLQASLATIISLCLAQLEPQHLSRANMPACNNACWSLGELALAIGRVDASALAPIAERVASCLASLLGAGHRVSRGLLDNAAIALGRVAWMRPEPLAPHLGHFVKPWCLSLRALSDGEEKEQAFLGLCRLIRLNPGAALASVGELLRAFLSWRDLPCEGLHNEAVQVVGHLRGSLEAGGQWQALLATLSAAEVDKLQRMYLPQA